LKRRSSAAARAPCADRLAAIRPRYCLGASLARTQLRSIFAELLRVVPDIEAHEPELLRSAFIHGVKRMDCSFRARA